MALEPQGHPQSWSIGKCLHVFYAVVDVEAGSTLSPSTTEAKITPLLVQPQHKS
jgi:hypothetical protein